MKVVMKMQINKHILISSLTALLLSGCAGQYFNSKTVTQPIQSLEQTTLCCDHFSDLAFKKLPAKFKANLALNSDDPVFDFETGKSYAEPILLPESDGPILLQIDSFISAPLPHKLSTVVYPVVTLLDENHKVLATLDQLPFKYSNIFQGRKIRMVATIDHNYGKVKYAVIHTSKEKQSQSISTRKPISIVQHADFDTMLYEISSKSRKRIRFSYSGNLQVIAFPLG